MYGLDRTDRTVRDVSASKELDRELRMRSVWCVNWDVILSNVANWDILRPMCELGSAMICLMHEI